MKVIAGKNRAHQCANMVSFVPFKTKDNSAAPAHREHLGRFGYHLRPDQSPSRITEPGSVKNWRPADINIQLRKIDAK